MHTILVVDDSPMIVDVFVAMLERGGFRPIAAYRDGWETLEKIKYDPEIRQIPVMMLTAKQLTPDEAQKYGVYIEDYIMKPTTHRQLYDAIEYVLKRQEKIQGEVEIAKNEGVDDKLIDEYERLSKSADVSKRLLKILESTYNINDPDLKVGEKIFKAINSMRMSITFQEERLEQIHQQFSK